MTDEYQKQTRRNKTYSSGRNRRSGAGENRIIRNPETDGVSSEKRVTSRHYSGEIPAEHIQKNAAADPSTGSYRSPGTTGNHAERDRRRKPAQRPAGSSRKSGAAVKSPESSRKSGAAAKSPGSSRKTRAAVKPAGSGTVSRSNVPVHEERDRVRQERRRKAAERRKRQLILHCILAAAVVIALITGLVILRNHWKQKALEPEGGTGTNILQAAEDAMEGSSGTSGSGTAGSGAAGENSETGDLSDSGSDPASAANSGADVADSESVDQISAETGSEDTESVTYDNRDGSITLCMVGDVILHQRLLDASNTGDGYNFDHLFANVSDEVKKYDIRIANQESIMGGPELTYSGYPYFNSPYEEADALADAGFNVVLQASNHALDKGAEGIQNCLYNWNTSHPEIAVLGIHDDSLPSLDYWVFEKNDISVAVLNYTYGCNLHNDEIASGELAGEVSFLDAEKVQQDIARAREEADYIVVCPHWGEENEMVPDSYQETWMENFLSWGVDLVIGTHPHVLQPVETYTRSDGSQMIVYYSLGNFISNQESSAGNVGAMAQVVIDRDEQGNVYTADYGVRTLVTHESRDGEAFTTYFLDEYSEEMAEENDVRATDPEFSYSYCTELEDQIFGEIRKLTVK
ncbi:MAG: CapA family protein [Lachnospiraceae bacterium]|nr:CapA family protein [Lachnospiraceae bacterium]